jgi:predicted Zn-dependent peptidase
MTLELALPEQGMATGVRIPPHERHTLGNGVRLILVPLHEVPLIAFEAVLRGGSRLDPPQREGVAALTAELLKYGAGARDAFAFADTVEGTGGSLDIEVHSEAIHVHGQFLAQDCELLLELLADALQRPHLSGLELDKLRQRRIESIRATKDSEPQSLLALYGRALLFGEHPYGRAPGGSESSLELIERAQVQQLYRRHFGADRLTLVFAGDFDPGRLRRDVSAFFGSWPAAEAALPPLPMSERVRGRRLLLIDSPGSEQSYLWCANVGVARAYPLAAALQVTNTAFGGKFGSMLMQALRVQTGLTYSVSSSFHRGSVPGEFSIGSFTQTSSTARAIDIVLQTLDRLKQLGIDAEALGSATNYMLGQYPLAFETASDWASALAKLDLYGLPDSYIDEFGAALQRVDRAQSEQVIATAFPDSADLCIAVIGDAAEMRTAIARFGSVLQKPLSDPDFAVGASGPLHY